MKRTFSILTILMFIAVPIHAADDFDPKTKKNDYSTDARKSGCHSARTT